MKADFYECDCGYIKFRTQGKLLFHGHNVNEHINGFVSGTQSLGELVNVDKHKYICKECEEKTSSENIIKALFNTVDDLVGKLFYYDRKEDEDLPVGMIEKQVDLGTVSISGIIEQFKEKVIAHFINNDNPSRFNFFQPRNLFSSDDLTGNEINYPEWVYMLRIKMVAAEVRRLVWISETMKGNCVKEVKLEMGAKWRRQFLGLTRISLILEKECGIES